MICKVKHIKTGRPARKFLWIDIRPKADIIYLAAGFWKFWTGYYRMHKPHNYVVGEYVEIIIDENDNVLKVFKLEETKNVKKL